MIPTSHEILGYRKVLRWMDLTLASAELPASSARPWPKRRRMETARHRYNHGRNIIPLEQHRVWRHFGIIAIYSIFATFHQKINFHQDQFPPKIITFHLFTYITEGKSPDDKINSAFCTNFFQISTFLHLVPELMPELYKNHSISPCANTVLNNTVESSTIFHSNLMLCINLVYEM
jgi:hypothetical protein